MTDKKQAVPFYAFCSICGLEISRQKGLKKYFGKHIWVHVNPQPKDGFSHEPIYQ